MGKNESWGKKKVGGGGKWGKRNKFNKYKIGFKILGEAVQLLVHMDLYLFVESSIPGRPKHLCGKIPL